MATHAIGSSYSITINSKPDPDGSGRFTIEVQYRHRINGGRNVGKDFMLLGVYYGSIAGVAKRFFEDPGVFVGRM